MFPKQGNRGGPGTEHDSQGQENQIADSGQSAPSGPARFDIRRQTDRQFLRSVYENISQNFPITEQGIRPEAMVLKNALDGYEFCKDKTGADPVRLEFETKLFDNHKEFTGNPAAAFYVKDVCLEVFGKVIEPNVEIADCQGADSTDPGQLAQIIRYIESASFIVYCVSSRNGAQAVRHGVFKADKKAGVV